MGFFAWFLKSPRKRSVATSNIRATSKHKKPQKKRYKFFLEKIVHLCPESNNR